MSAASKKSEEVVRQFAQGLSTLDLEMIAFLLRPEFKFIYQIADYSGHGITTDIRFIGHLFKTFTRMKQQGITSIKTDFCDLEIDEAKYLGIRLLPPHEPQILFPMYEQKMKSMEHRLPKGEAILIPTIKDGLLHKMRCCTSLREAKFWGKTNVLQPIGIAP